MNLTARSFWTGTLLTAQLMMAGIPPAAQAPASSPKPIVRILEARQPGGVALLVTNPFLAPITLELRPELENMKAEGLQAGLFVCPPRQTRQLVTLRVTNPQQHRSYRYDYHWMWGSPQAVHDTRATYALPFDSGTTHRVTQGAHGALSHQGESAQAIDFEMPIGTVVRAARDGLVIHVQDGFGSGGLDPAKRSQSNEVVILHDDGTLADYGHLLQGSLRVGAGKRVKAGDALAASGRSGYASGPHLHFSVYRALNARQRESIPIRFRLTDGTSSELRAGVSYQAP